MEIAKLILEYLKVLIWPSCTIFIVIYFQNQFKELIKRIKKANFPGNVSIETFPEMIEDGKIYASNSKKELDNSEKHKDIAKIPLNEVNKKLIDRKLKPSQSGLDFTYYENISKSDPNLALAGIRMELEVMSHNLISGFDISMKKTPLGVIQILRKLLEEEAITTNQYDLGKIVLQLCNRAIHGTIVTTDEAKEVIEIAKVLADQFIEWLSWGFSDETEHLAP